MSCILYSKGIDDTMLLLTVGGKRKGENLRREVTEEVS